MKKLLVIVISLIMLVSLCGCSSDSRIDELEKRVEVLENAVGINENVDNSNTNDNSTANIESDTNTIDYKNTFRICLFCDVNTNGFYYDTYYEVVKQSDNCIFTYYGKGDDFASTAFSLEVFDELVELIGATGIEEYEPQYDANGKIIYEDLPYTIQIGVNKSDFYYLKNPSNLNEIVEKFESLKALAKE